jgi:hypothetical protein
MIPDPINGQRRYGVWAGQPKGMPEDPNRCIEEVHASRWISHQCSRKRGHGPDGLYCKQHAKQHTVTESFQ